LGEEIPRNLHLFAGKALQWGRRVHSAKRPVQPSIPRARNHASMGSPSSLGEELAAPSCCRSTWSRRLRTISRRLYEGSGVGLARASLMDEDWAVSPRMV